MPIQILYVTGGAMLIAALGRWSNQHRITILVLCTIWGGIVSRLLNGAGP